MVILAKFLDERGLLKWQLSIGYVVGGYCESTKTKGGDLAVNWFVTEAGTQIYS